MNALDDLGRQDALEGLASLGAVLFSLGSITYLGLGDISLLGHNFTDVLFSIGGINVETASIISVLAIIVGYASTNRNVDDWGDLQSILGYATIGAVVLLEISPPFYNWVTGTQEIALGVWILFVLGYSTIAGMGDFGGGR